MTRQRNYQQEYASRNQRSYEAYGFGYSLQRRIREGYSDADSRLARAETSHQRRIKRLLTD